MGMEWIDLAGVGRCGGLLCVR